MLTSCLRTRRSDMLDLVFVGLGLAGFVLMGAYVVLCDRL
jgi:hypothetical protein